MILRRLRVERIRRHNRPVEVYFDKGLTVIEGPNEIGKSTLFTAIEYGFFSRSSAGGADIKRLEPWDGSGLRPHIIIDFAFAGTEYRLDKDWSSAGRTIVSKLDAGGQPTTYLMDGADDWLLKIFAGEGASQGFREFKSTNFGLAHLLFARQGSIVLSADCDGLNETADGRLTELIGAVAQSDDETRIIDRIGRRLKEFWTPNNRRKTSAPSNALQLNAVTLKTNIQVIEAQRREFGDVGRQVDEADEELARARDARDRRGTEFKEMLPRVMAAAEARRILEGAERDLAEKKRLFDEIVNRLQQIGDCDRDREARIADLEPKETRLRDAELQKIQADGAFATATDAFSSANAADPDFETAQIAVERTRRAQIDRVEYDRWQSVVNDVSQIDVELEALAATSATENPTETDVRTLRESLDRRTAIERDLRDAETVVSIRALADLAVTEGATRHNISAGTFLELTGQRVAFSIPGVVDIEARGPIADVEALRVENGKLDGQLSAFARRFGSIDLDAITIMKFDAERREADRQRAKVRRQALLGQRDIIEVRVQVADLVSRIAIVGVGLDLATLEANLIELTALRDARRAAAHTAFQSAQTAVGIAHELVRSSETVFNAIRQRIGEVDATLGALLSGSDREALREKRVSADTASAEAVRLEAIARIAYEPYREFKDPAADLVRLQNEQKAHQDTVNRYENTVTTLRFRYDQLQQLGLFTRLTEFEDQLTAVESALTEACVEEDAILLLSQKLQKALGERRAGLASSIESRVVPWFERVTNTALVGFELGSKSEIDNVKLPFASAPVKFRELSTGAADQLGALVRLAFADLLANGEPLPVLLDDPLVNGDSRRRAAMLDILLEVSQRTQIIVFTCRREDYLGSGATIASIESAVGVP